MIKTCINPDCRKEFETEKEKQVCCSGACYAMEKKRKALEKMKAKKKKVKKVVKRKPIIPLEVDLSEFIPTDKEIEDEMFHPVINEVPLGLEPLFHLPPEPWIKEIKDYCEEASITPLDLIEYHKTGNKPAKKKDSDNLGLTYFQQLQNRKALGK